MNSKSLFKFISRASIVTLLVLNLIIALDQPASEVLAQTSILPSETLYQQALSWEYNKNDFIRAAIYMYAYVQRNPPEYATNSLGRKDIADQKLAIYMSATDNSVKLLTAIKSDPNACKNLGQAGLCTTYAKQTLPPPPDAVLVCTAPQYQGTCRILFVGDYSSFPNMGINDVVSSVMIGSRVKLTLYLHARFDSQYITFISNDPDLGNNPIDSKYFWSKNASAARVQWK